ncbi:hypothetical protein FRB97_004339 [Tulasnella sp. 331]|nr:hypothetical protein FRB97_004339 [Tulasnella sp. 331]
MPVIATALTTAGITQDNEKISFTERDMLMNIATALREYRQQGLRLETGLASINVAEPEIFTHQAKLKDITRFLDPLKVNFEFPSHVVSAGFALSGLTGKAIDASASTA